MSVTTETLTGVQAEVIILTEEGQFAEVKAIEITPANLSKTISAFANSDGGDLYIGIQESEDRKERYWKGFWDAEAANGHLQLFETLFPLGAEFQYEFLRCAEHRGLVLHAQINKSKGISKASNRLPYIRRGAQNLPVDTPEGIKNLEYNKGISSFESQPTTASKEMVTKSEVVEKFIAAVVPTAEPEPWLKKQALIEGEKPTVAGLLLFSDEPQAILPKQSGIKIYQYKTNEPEGFREALAFTPRTIEGCLYDQIKQAVRETTEIAESIPKMGGETLEAIQYPAETLHEIITNAVLHRDYRLADDVHIRIFDNRIEVESPGSLPAHITVKNILTERFARNGSVVRILNKFPNPPNKDVGEGLKTANDAMHRLGLKAPIILAKENSVLVNIKHEQLASPEEAIMDYLETHETIKNREARRITYIRADYQMKSIFGRMVKAGMIEQVPGTRTSGTAYRKKPPPTEDAP